jgi:tetratricopeptide (TPR) repeat protein
MEGLREEDFEIVKASSVQYGLELDKAEQADAEKAFATQIEAGTVTPDQISRLAARCASVEWIDGRMGEALASTWQRTDADHDDCAALVRAALDAAVVAPSGVQKQFLFEVATEWLLELNSNALPMSQERFDQAFKWTRECVTTGSSWALINRVATAGTDEDLWRLFDAVAARWLPNHRPKEWLEEQLEPWQLFNLASDAYQRGEVDSSIRVYRKAADAGEANALNNLGLLLQQKGDLDEAKEYFRRAIEAGNTEAGNTEAMVNLGVLLKDKGDLDGAEEFYRRAIEAGDA